MSQKMEWQGELVSVQARIRLWRSFDQRSHSYLGYVFRVRGTTDGEQREFGVAVGPSAHEKHQFRIGNQASGFCVPVADPRLETAEFYRASGLTIVARGEQSAGKPPPFLGIPPPLEEYRARGHRRLAARRYRSKCTTCIWGCEMAVEMIIDQWNPSVRRYRRETFCYGPKSCRLYAAGPTRKVPGRSGMSWEEENWIDEEVTSHRGPDA
ncbi:MAG TPA: hypothetical protein VM118_09330 [Acidobacteriota bacterium]|nr:hypothetical protein [Acidobacteriota bacterium]